MRDLSIQVLVLLLAATIHLVCALDWHPGMDEYWHLYFGEIEPFSYFIDEVRKDTHPPLTYVWLRWLTEAGADPVFGRLSSILPSLATVPLVFLWLRGLSVQVFLAHMATLVLAVSSEFTSIGIVVRSYALATFATLLVFHLATPVLRDPRTLTRTRLIVCLVAWLCGPWSLYTAFFPMLVLTIVVGGWCVLRPGFGRALWSRLCTLRVWPEFSLFLLFVLVLPLYFHWTRPAELTGYLADHFPEQGGSALMFLIEAFARNLTLFLRFDFTSMPFVACGLGLGLIGYGILRHACPLRAPRDPARAIVFLTLFGVTAQLALLAVFELHPFGGTFRHQYVMAPFLLASLLLVLDDLLRKTSFSVRVLVPVLIVVYALASAKQSYLGPIHDELYRDGPLWEEDYRLLASNIEADAVVYTSTFSRVGLYGRAREDGVWRRTARHIGMLNRFDVVEGHLGTHAVHFVFGPRWTFPLRPDQTLVEDLRVVFGTTGRNRVWVISMHEQPSAGTDDALRHAIADALKPFGWELADYVRLPAGHAYAIERT